MKSTRYVSIADPEQGFAINEDFEVKYHRNGTETKTKNKLYQVWHDPYEGGEAYDTDWTFLDEFKSFQEAKSYIETNYGKVKKL